MEVRVNADRRFVAVLHSWFVYSKGFEVVNLEAATLDEAIQEANALAYAAQKPFNECAAHVVEIEIGERVVLPPRRLTWWERITGELDPPDQI